MSDIEKLIPIAFCIEDTIKKESHFLKIGIDMKEKEKFYKVEKTDFDFPEYLVRSAQKACDTLNQFQREGDMFMQKYADELKDK